MGVGLSAAAEQTGLDRFRSSSRCPYNSWALLFIVGSSRLTQTDTRAPSVFIYEFDTCYFKGSSYHFKSGSPGFTRHPFKLSYRYNANASPVGEVLLRPVEQATGCPTLGGCDHAQHNKLPVNSIKTIENQLTPDYIFYRYNYLK